LPIAWNLVSRELLVQHIHRRIGGIRVPGAQTIHENLHRSLEPQADEWGPGAPRDVGYLMPLADVSKCGIHDG
jgi:hypothetical protein